MPKIIEDEVIYFNNCKNRRHAEEYGETSAFFDLDTTGRQANQAVDLPVGQECVVASRQSSDRLKFDWYSLLKEEVCKDRHGDSGRVFFGERLESEIMTQARATKTKVYAPFFNINGDFKRPSVLSSSVRPRMRPTKGKNKTKLFPEEVDASDGPFLRSAIRKVTVNAYERSAKARAKCIKKHGAVCFICKFSFGDVYGADFDGFIHVHHLRLISKLKKTYRVDPIDDLRPVCPNCHAVIHFGGENRSIDEVKSMLKL